MSETDDVNITYTPLLEKFFSDTGERCEALSVAHKMAEEYYSRLTAFIDIPVILLGIFNGSASIGSQNLFGDARFASVGIGLVALSCASLTAINNYFGWSRRSEQHKQSSIEYGRLYRFLSTELGLPRTERQTAKKLLIYVRDEYDRLATQSRLLPTYVKKQFIDRYGDIKNVSLPQELNGLDEIIIYDEKKDSEKGTSVQSAFEIHEEKL